MTYDVIIIGGGAAGLMAAYGAATALSSRKDNRKVSVAVLEKMPRPGRKIMITGKGRCNFTNMKDWSAFPHISVRIPTLSDRHSIILPLNDLQIFPRKWNGVGHGKR